jgi:1,2-diacylglycerol 3-alpha-glucosyltransferase
LVFAQTTSLLLEFGGWLRDMLGIPMLCVNTTHLVAAYDVLLPESLARYELVHAGLMMALKKPYEQYFASIYNESDGLVVLSEGLRTYWRERGVTAPIHVIPRAVQPEIFDRPVGTDPYTEFLTTEGPRLLCAGRHTREKEQDRVIRIFARYILPNAPGATLTLLGNGPDSEYYRRIAEQEGVASSVHFPGEVPFTRMPDFYAYADVFVHASLSETYGNVMGEALWCGTPTDPR